MDYPSDEELTKVAEWRNDWVALLDYVGTIWSFAEDDQGTPTGFRKSGRRYRLATGGWSGNEDIIGALANNGMFWSMCWTLSKRGGLHKFRVQKVALSATEADKEALLALQKKGFLAAEVCQKALREMEEAECPTPPTRLTAD